MIDASDNLADDSRDLVNLALLRHEINFIVQSLGYLQDGVNEESIVQSLLLFAKMRKHLFAQLMLHLRWEVV